MEHPIQRHRRRPLTQLARRSPLHAAGVWHLRAALTALLFLAMYLLIINVLLPGLVDGFVERINR